MTDYLLALDLETTTPDPTTASIIEIGFVYVNAATGEVHTPWGVRVNPGVPIPSGSTAVHGITDADVEDMPAFDAYAPAVASHLSGEWLRAPSGGDAPDGRVVALLTYNGAHFDAPILRRHMETAGQSYAAPRHIDVRHLARRLYPAGFPDVDRRGRPRRSDTLTATHAGLGFPSYRAHAAVDDARATARIYCAISGDAGRTLPAVDRFVATALADEAAVGRWLVRNRRDEWCVGYGSSARGEPIDELTVAELQFRRRDMRSQRAPAAALELIDAAWRRRAGDGALDQIELSVDVSAAQGVGYGTFRTALSYFARGGVIYPSAIGRTQEVNAGWAMCIDADLHGRVTRAEYTSPSGASYVVLWSPDGRVWLDGVEWTPPTLPPRASDLGAAVLALG